MLIFIMAIYPLVWERTHLLLAREGIMSLSKIVNTLLLVDNNRLIIEYPNLSIQAAFKKADDAILGSVKCILNMLTSPERVITKIGISIKEIKEIFSRSRCGIVTSVTVPFQSRISQAVVKELFFKPKLLFYEELPKLASEIMIYLESGRKFTLGMANSITEAIYEITNLKAQRYWGLRVDPKLGDNVRTTAIFKADMKDIEALLTSLEEKTCSKFQYR